MENKLLRNGVSVLLVVVMIIGVFSVPVLTGDKVNAASMKLNKKKITIKVGNTYKLKVKNKGKKKVKWRTSKKGVVTVSKSGKLKAKKVGKATITAKVGKKKFKCKVTVKKAATGAISNPALATGGVTVSNRYGKMYFKATILKNDAAIAKLKSINDWASYDVNVHNKYSPSNDFVVAFYDVKAVSGFKGKDKLSGMDVINTYRVYNSTGKKRIVYPTRFGGTNREYISNVSLSLNGGQSGKMSMGFYIPKGTSSFMAPIYKANSKFYWVKYNF